MPQNISKKLYKSLASSVYHCLNYFFNIGSLSLYVGSRICNRNEINMDLI